MSCFNLKIHLTDEDYLKFNLFHQLRSPYGKQQILSLRIMIAAIFVLSAFLALFLSDFSGLGFVYAVPLILALVIMEIFSKPFFGRALKRRVKILAKKGKMAYAPDVEMEFFDDYFTEITPESRAEQKYSLVERVSIVGTGEIYLHVNNLGGFILPRTAFSSGEERAEFIRFIKTKCETVDFYTEQ